MITKFVIDGTLKKLGLNMEGVSQGQYADSTRRCAPFIAGGARARSQEHMQATYDTFVEKAAQGRNTTPREDRRDRAGPGLDRAAGEGASASSTSSAGSSARCAIAKQRAKIAQDTDVELVVYPPKKSFYEIVENPFGSRPRRRAGVAARLQQTRGRCRRSPRRCRSSAAASRWR